jgi:hypothetical protein
MANSSSIAQMRVAELIETIGDKGLSAGAGAAGAVTLALAPRRRRPSVSSINLPMTPCVDHWTLSNGSADLP